MAVNTNGQKIAANPTSSTTSSPTVANSNIQTTRKGPSNEQTLAYQQAYNSRNDGEAAAREQAAADAERRIREAEEKAAAEQKAKEEQKAFHDSVFNNIDNAVANADEMTKQQALNTASDGFNNYQSVGRAQSAAYSTNDDTYNAAAFNAENKMTNRQTAFQAAVEAGSAQLEARGEQTAANNLAEAAKLSADAETQSKWSDTIATIASILKGASE